ncbi:MAG: polysaccharide biosynthesis protein [Methanomicrobia archaeon]|nr:polysaccharide biosynthesis protein [Methanomicrobia archaeon]
MIGGEKIYQNKIILVTGGVGSIGSEIVRAVLRGHPEAVRVLDNNETGLFDLEQELQSGKIRPFVGDIRDKERLERAIEDVDIIFHAAALKHVPLCEYNPFEAVKTNVIGTQNVIEAAMDAEVEKVITISTDKAVNPVNVMGATKLLAERLTVSANFYKGDRKTVFSCVRFGNVLDTRGSVIPLFKKQLQNGGPLTVTDPDMTRFIMSISKAVELVLKAAKMAQGDELFILKMPAVRIGDLAARMIEDLAPKYGKDPNKIEIKIIGRRYGEKMHEELMTENEALTAYEGDELFLLLQQDNSYTETRLYNLPENFKKAEDIKYTSRTAPLISEEEIQLLLSEFKT